MIYPELLKPILILRSSNCYKTRSAPRFGVMWHYDDSSSDEGSWRWFTDPACKVSYNRLYQDDADVVSVADDDWAAWHAGACLHPNANSSFYGLAASTNGQTPATKVQLGAMIEDTVRLFRKEGWSAHEVQRRLVGHDEQAIFTKQNTPRRPELWGKLGRKPDPTGKRRDGVKIIDMDSARIVVAMRLGAGAPVIRKRPVLKRGSTNSVAVAELQALLGMAPANPGTFGPLTEERLKNFQRLYGLDDDGIAGDETWAKLEQVSEEVSGQ